MYNSLSYKTKQFLWGVIKLSIVIGCGAFIYLRLLENTQIDFFRFLSKIDENELFLVKNPLFLLLFSSFNWFFEILKWKKLTSSVKNITFSEAAKQSLASLTTSLITPNRIGEYGAKALYFEKEHQKKILGLNFIGNFYQMLATMFFGLFGFGLVLSTQQNVIHYPKNTPIFTLGFLFVFILFFLKKNDFGQKLFQKAIRFTRKIPKETHLKIALFSGIRYIIFTHQFYFLLLIFTVEISYFEAIAVISTVYLIASLVPMLSLFDVVLKGSVALWVFHFYQADELSILSVTTLMWLFNFVVPAVIGSYFVFTFKPPFTR